MNEQNEKQAIEEMALDLFKIDHCRHLPQEECKRTSCVECEAATLYNAGYRKQSELTPCDVCKFNPPSSGDGKPCAMCPAQAKGAEP